MGEGSQPERGAALRGAAVRCGWKQSEISETTTTLQLFIAATCELIIITLTCAACCCARVSLSVELFIVYNVLEIELVQFNRRKRR